MSEAGDKALVEALYRVLLGREPEAGGLDAHRNGLAAGLSYEALIEGFARSEEFDARLPRFAERFGLHVGRLTLDSSQYGEVPLLLDRMLARAAPTRLVVDVGVRGRDGSNSYDLMRYFGWRGVLIEANPDLRGSIEREFAGLDFTYIACAVGDYEGDGVLTLAEDDGMSSLLAEHAAHLGPTRGSVPVKVRRLADLLVEAGVPHEFAVLSLDIEGMDAAVLNDLVAHSAYRPSWIIIEGQSETLFKGEEQGALSQAVREVYEVVGATWSNLILERR